MGEYKNNATEISFTGTPMYEISLAKPGGETATVKSGDTFLLPCDYTLMSFTDKTGAPGLILIHQPQGSCTYTEPAVVGTFASFDPGSSTYVSLRDERDNKVYPVVKIGGRWIMALNLNYQTGLTFNSASNQANGKTFNTPGSGISAIGSFWCPGGVNGNATTSSSTYSCEVWGALYTWETAMMVDGKWSNDTRDNTAWGSDPPTSASTNTGNTNNDGRGANGHGICPAGWHVPTDGEWGDLLNVMETGTKNHNTSTGWIGTNAGTIAKSKCMCSSGSCNNDENVSWSNGTVGTDVYGFRVLPSGYRGNDGSYFYNRGSNAYFWSSSAYDGSYAWHRQFYYSYATVGRGPTYRSYGFSVRCMKN
jgi:uncharacterized protein (TIGR02145 family)